jgi:hypothetical protein
MDRIHNLYITSQTNKAGNTNYNYNLYFSSYGINISQDEDAYLNITSFQTLNTFYNINDKSNKFMIKYVYGSGNGSGGGGGGGGGGNGNSGGSGVIYRPFIIDQGNYNIYEFEEIINYLCEQYFSIKYDSKKNKWYYKRNPNISFGDSIYIIPNEYNYKYFGLNANEEAIIFSDDDLLSNQINLNNFGLIVIKVMGLVETNRTLDNLNKNISSGDIYALITRQDNAVNSLINWIDYNGTFKKKIGNNEINYLNFIFMDEYNNLLVDINDWLLTLTITIKKKLYQPLPMLRE